ncbi:MAG: hypothetical protein ABTQ26_01805 [Azonexus sp.]
MIARTLMLTLLLTTSSCFAWEGVLLADDLKLAKIAFQDLLRNDAKSYRLDEKASGCGFDKCTSVVQRVANFISITSPPEASVERIKIIRCEAQPGQKWTCSSRASYRGKVPSLTKNEFYVQPEIDDEAILKLLKFVKSDCAYTYYSQEKDANFAKRIRTTQLWGGDFVHEIRFEQEDNSYKIELAHMVNRHFIWHVKSTEDNGLCDFFLMGIGEKIIN